MQKKRTILISAYGCEPEKGSEAGVGWNWVLQLAKENNLHVITRANNKESVETNLPQDVAANVVFHYYDTNKFFRKIKKGDKGLYFYYFLWQIGICSLVRKLLRQTHFDYTMHLTFGSLWMPTFLPFFKVPFIWGPIGGGDCVPKPFLRDLPLKQRLIQSFRYILNGTSALNPLIAFPSRKAVSIIVRTENTGFVIPKKYRYKVDTMLETAMSQTEVERSAQSKEKCDPTTIRLITTGRLVPFKNIKAIISALKYVPSSYKIRLTVIGSGGEAEKLRNQIVRDSILHEVEFIPQIPRNEVLNHLSESDIYVFPSLREGGSWSLMEAMATGLPVICLKWTGMEIITDDHSAIRLPVTNPQQLSEDIASAICRLIDDAESRTQMGKAGQKRIKDVFNWDMKGKFMETVFTKLENNNYR